MHELNASDVTARTCRGEQTASRPLCLCQIKEATTPAFFRLRALHCEQVNVFAVIVMAMFKKQFMQA
jgi:hypothetical protein